MHFSTTFIFLDISTELKGYKLALKTGFLIECTLTFAAKERVFYFRTSQLRVHNPIQDDAIIHGIT